MSIAPPFRRYRALNEDHCRRGADGGLSRSLALFNSHILRLFYFLGEADAREEISHVEMLGIIGRNNNLDAGWLLLLDTDQTMYLAQGA